MKRVLTVLFLALLGVPAPAFGQAAIMGSQSSKLNSRKHLTPLSGPRKPATATCNLECCQESFPYDFCNSKGQKITICSKDPENDPAGSPAKAFFPGCVTMMNSMPPDGLFMPTTDPPQLPPIDVQEPDQNDPNFAYDYYVWSGASGQLGVDQYQWSTGQPPIPPTVQFDPGIEPICCLDDPPDCDTDTCEQWHADEDAYDAYLGSSEQYFSDDSAWTASATDYAQIWNDADAQADATEALMEWENVCAPPVQPDGPSCCIHVYLDNNSRDFGGTTKAGQTVDNDGNAGYPKCGESTCADLTRFIEINISTAFTNQDLQSAVPNVAEYTYYAVHPTGFYTDRQFNPKVYSGFSVGSFFNLIQHEIGHFLGLHHPEGDPGQGDYFSCTNCYTANPVYFVTGAYNPDGYQTIMAQNNIQVNEPTFELTDEDKCQFQKLYCPDNVDWAACPAGVKEPSAVSPAGPEVYPNPTNGACQLSFDVPIRDFVQIAIYDVLGNRLRLVTSDYENAGTRSISLGTESLPPGHYVCRIRVGENVTYLNVAIER